jgi:hypothetical protein
VQRVVIHVGLAGNKNLIYWPFIQPLAQNQTAKINLKKQLLKLFI